MATPTTPMDCRDIIRVLDCSKCQTSAMVDFDKVDFRLFATARPARFESSGALLRLEQSSDANGVPVQAGVGA